MKWSDNSNRSNEPASVPEQNIRKELEHICASKHFVGSPRLSEMLQFVVEESLQGRGERIKAFTIAQAVFGRDESFDQQRDTIVRVEAGRLRRRLADYYADATQDHAVLIEIPKGGYAPKISLLAGSTGNRRLKVAFGIAAPVIVAIAITLAWWSGTDRREGEAASSSNPDVLMAEPAVPFIAVLPLELSSEDPREQRLASGYVESVITSLAKLSGLSVMAHASMIEFGDKGASIQTLKNDFGVSHVLRGRLQLEDNFLHMNVQLVKTETSKIIWADSMKGSLDEMWTLQQQLASQVVEAMAIEIQPAGRDNFLKRHTNNAETLAYYRQALLLLSPPNEMTRIHAARSMFIRSSELDPGFAGGFAGEGFSHAITVLFLQTDDPDKELEKSIDLAGIAIETDPGFGMAYVSLAFAQTLSGNTKEAQANSEIALGLSPGDAFVQFIYGLNLVISGKPEQAIEPLNKALRLNPAEPRTPYLNVLGIAHFAGGDYQTAINIFEQNMERGGPAGPHMDLHRAAAYALLGKNDKAREIIESLKRSYPDFPHESLLRLWLGNSGKLETILEQMKALGLPADLKSV